MSKVVCVVPTIRPERMTEFRAAWAPLFERHGVTLVTVFDGDTPRIDADVTPWVRPNRDPTSVEATEVLRDGFEWGDLFCRRTDAVRNVGFVVAAKLGADFVLTLDDDCLPPVYDEAWEEWGKLLPRIDRLNMSWRGGPHDPIQGHLDALSKRVPISWMNTAHMGAEYLRGVPYRVRDESPVMLSHGVWVGTPDFDGETQLRLEKDGGVPHTLPYYVGPVPKGVLFPLCGMSVMVRKEALPYLYFAPMGPDSGVEGLHRFADIWMGIHLKMEFDKLGWACYTGASTVLHSRASDAAKNFEQEKLGRLWNEAMAGLEDFGERYVPFCRYVDSWVDKRARYAELIRSIQGG